MAKRSEKLNHFSNIRRQRSSLEICNTFKNVRIESSILLIQVGNISFK